MILPPLQGKGHAIVDSARPLGKARTHGVVSHNAPQCIFLTLDRFQYRFQFGKLKLLIGLS
jgi:hypothetical protein